MILSTSFLFLKNKVAHSVSSAPCIHLRWYKMASAEPVFRIIMRAQVCIGREMRVFYLGDFRERKLGAKGWRGVMPPLRHQGMPERS